VRGERRGERGGCISRGGAYGGGYGNGDEKEFAERGGAEELRFASAAVEQASFGAREKDAAILAAGGFGVAQRGERFAIGVAGSRARGDGVFARGFVVLRDFGADLRGGVGGELAGCAGRARCRERSCCESFYASPRITVTAFEMARHSARSFESKVRPDFVMR
jgi:hypothetical protein